MKRSAWPLESDQTFKNNIKNSGRKGLKAARGMGLLTYRTFEAYKERQTDDDGRLDDFRASSYIQYQGKKLADRFHAHCYWFLTKCLDSHNIGRGRGGVEKALSKIKIPVTVISISTDCLVPSSEQKIYSKTHTQCQIPRNRLPFWPRWFSDRGGNYRIYFKAGFWTHFCP